MSKIDARSTTTIAIGLVATLAGTTPAKGNIIDLRDYQAATLAVTTGAVTAAGDAGLGFVIEESDTTADADFTAVADADLIGTEAALAVTSNGADNIAVGSVGYIGTKRYVRVVGTGTANTNALVALIWVLQKPGYAPPVAAAANIAAA